MVTICGRCLETPIREKDHDTDDRKKRKRKKRKMLFLLLSHLPDLVDILLRKNKRLFRYLQNKEKKDVKEKQRIFQIRENER